MRYKLPQCEEKCDVCDPDIRCIHGWVNPTCEAYAFVASEFEKQERARRSRYLNWAFITTAIALAVRSLLS